MKKIYILFLFLFIGFSGNSQQSIIPYSQILSNYPTLSNNNFSCGSPEWIEFNDTASLIFDLGKVHTINRIDAWWCLFTYANVKIFTSYSILGPWNKVFEIYDNNLTTNPSYNFTNKSSRYWKIDISAGAGAWRRLVEVQFYEIPALTSLNSSVLKNWECTTITSTTTGETYQWSTGETTQSINVCNSGTYTVNVTNTSFIGNQDYSASIAVSKLGSQDNLPGPNGEVYAIYKNGNNVYIGGDFNAFGPVTGSGTQIDTSSGIANTALPRVDGTINTAISDGNGGWYIGGLFTRVGSYVKNNLAHIKADNTLDTVFKPEPNGAVNTLALYGSSLYAGGAFSTVKTIANNYAAKIDAATGDPYLWNANANGIVRSIQLYADQIIFGGNFTSLGGATRNYLGAVDTVYIQATTWNPNENAAVYKVYVNGTKLYAGGDFTTIGGVSKQYGCGFTLPAFTTDGYNMGANGRITDFLLNGNVLYAAGSFTVIGGASRNYIAAMNYLNALTNTFNATADGVINTLAIAGGNLIVGGAFSNIGGAVRNRLASLNLTSGTAAGWNPNVVGLKVTTSTVSCLATQGTNIYAGGSFYSVGASVRNNLAAIDATTGQLTSWDPNVNNIVRAIWADNNYVYLGGDFTTVNSSITKNHIAQLSATTAVATGWNPNADNSVYALTVKGTTLFAGGSFANIGGAVRAKIAALSTTSGAATAFNPTANGNVNALCIGGDTLYIGGAFTSIGGQTRNRIASYNISGITLTALNPNADNIVNALSFANNKLYIGGSFANVFATARVNMAEFDVLSNTLTSLNPGAINTSGVNALFSKDSSLYLGGGFNFPNQGNPINNLGSINTSGAYIGYWQPQPDNIIRTIFASDNKVYVGGNFKNITSRYQPYFASTDIFLMATPLITSVSPVTACENSVIIVKGSGFTGVTSVKIGGVSTAYTLVSSDTIAFLANATMSGTIAITNALGTVTSTQSISVTAAPTAPSLGAITQPSCLTATGSVVLNSLPATGTWTINPGNISGSGTTTTISNLTAATYNYTVTNASNCTSSASTNLVINTQPTTPTAPTLGIITQPSCSVATGSVVLNGLPATGSWTINPGNISGSGTTTTISNLAAATYNYTVTNASSCTSVASANLVINTQPITPTAPTVGTITQPSCSVATGSVVLNGLPSIGSWTINPGNISGSGTTTTISNLTAATYNYTITNASSCTSVASANVVINTQPVTPTAPTVGTITQPSCSVSTGSVVLNGLPASGSWTLNPGNITGTGITKTITGLAAATYNYTVTNASSCTSVASANVVINTQPSTPTSPIVGTITQPTCSVATGSVILSGLPSTGTWTINPGNISGSGTSTTISNLVAATYNYTVTNASSCTSVASANVVINTQPTTPTAPTVGTITQPSCSVATGSVVLNGLPATGSWAINPGNISGSGTTTTISNLAAATYNYTVTNSSSCISVASANVVISAQPSTPTAPTVGTITQPSCTVATGSVVLNGLPSSGSWTINPGSITGTGTTKIITSLVAATYNYTVTNASNCTSVASANVVINTQPTTPSAPIVGTITQPSCSVATGSVVLNGLPSTGSWTINPGNISGSGTTTTISSLTAATYNFTVTNSTSCTSAVSANIVINASISTPSAPTVGTITQPSCTVATGSVVLNGLPSSGSWTINPGNISGSGITTTISNLTAATYNYTVTNASSCTSVASANVVINTQPSTPTAPTVGIITQSTCFTLGSVVLSGLPTSTGGWTINPGNITGTGASTTLSNLTAGTYNYTVTNASNCTSVTSANVVINTQPSTPTAPTIGTITQPGCTVATGSVVLNGLPSSGSWTINPGNISGSGTTTTISNLAAATYNYTVTNASSCTSVASAIVVINTQPVTPTAPSVGTITQPTCITATGSVVLNGLPSSGSWTINPGNISGSGSTTTLTNIVTGTYNFTVTNASSCISVASTNVVINTQPLTPTAPTIGTITQPSCTVATGSVVLNGLPSSGSWIINPGNISGSGISTTISNLTAGTYNYNVTNASSCTSVASTNVVINTQPVTPPTPVITLNINVLQSNAALGNQWYNLTTGLISGATASTYNPVQTGNYFTIVTLNGCQSDSSNVLYYNYIGVNEFSLSNNIKVYPNPVHNELILELKGNIEKLSFEILDAIGQVIFKGKLIEKTIVQTTNFTPGIYLIKLENGKSFEFKKIVKE